MNDYPKNWKDISLRAKARAKFRCERCKHPNDPGAGHTLTVHHLDMDKANNAIWNLAVLCQRCHLSIQSRVNMDQMLLPGAEVADWFKPHLEGYVKAHGKPSNPCPDCGEQRDDKFYQYRYGQSYRCKPCTSKHQREKYHRAKKALLYVRRVLGDDFLDSLGVDGKPTRQEVVEPR
jgi:hypothetical protein